MKGLKVGTNIESNTDDQLVYSSEWNNWKIFDEGSKDLVIPPDMEPRVTEITHGLGYVPAVEVWGLIGGKHFTAPGYDENFDVPFDFAVDSNKIYFYGANYTWPEVQKTVTFKYTIYYERIDA